MSKLVVHKVTKGLMEVETGNKDIGYYTNQVHSLRIRSDTNEKMRPTPLHLKMANRFCFRNAFVSENKKKHEVHKPNNLRHETLSKANNLLGDMTPYSLAELTFQIYVLRLSSGRSFHTTKEFNVLINILPCRWRQIVTPKRVTSYQTTANTITTHTTFFQGSSH